MSLTSLSVILMLLMKDGMSKYLTGMRVDEKTTCHIMEENDTRIKTHGIESWYHRFKL